MEVLNVLVLDLSALSGMATENMNRGFGWRFLDLGRRLERAVSLCQLLTACFRLPGGCAPVLDPVLEIADSTMTYRRRHFSEPQLARVLDLLVREVTNPRSLAFQLQAIADHALHLPDGANPAGAADIRTRISTLAGSPGSWLGDESTADQADVEADGRAEHLAALGEELAEISDLVTHVYHSHVLPRVS